jgi:hypothetical protein
VSVIAEKKKKEKKEKVKMKIQERKEKRTTLKVNNRNHCTIKSFQMQGRIHNAGRLWIETILIPTTTPIQIIVSDQVIIR